jgi:hypothetical protein
MTQGSELTQLQVAIPRQEAEEILTEFLRDKGYHQPWNALSWLQDLLNHHLIQLGAEDKIEFRHQLIQEYYTAESLLKQLPHLSNDSLKREYLNYLKWTEPLVLMLELVDNKALAERVVQLALEVELRLAARLAGAVKPEFQEKTVALVAEVEIPQKVRIELLGITRSDRAVSALVQALNHEDYDVRTIAAYALGNIGNEAAVSALVQALNHEDYDVRTIAAYALENIGNEAAVPALVQALNDEDYDVRSSAAYALGNIGNEAAVSALVQALNDEDYYVRRNAAEALGKIASSELLPYLSELPQTTGESNLFNIIIAIQERYKYYNYTLTQPETSLKPQPNIPPKQPISIPLMHILHLSDLHFGTSENAQLWYRQLAADLRHELKCTHLDAVILSGDIANKSTLEEYDAAKLFIDKLITTFQLKSDRIVIVPGNHDINWGLAKQAYILMDRQDYQSELQEGCYSSPKSFVEKRRGRDMLNYGSC